MAKKHKHVYGPVVATSEDGTTEKYQACRICGIRKK